MADKRRNKDLCIDIRIKSNGRDIFRLKNIDNERGLSKLKEFCKKKLSIDWEGL